MRSSVTVAMIAALLLCPPLPVSAAEEGVAGSFEVDGRGGAVEGRNARFARANELAAAGKAGEAEAIYLALIAERADEPEPYNNLAALYAATGRLEEAGELLGRALATDRRYQTVYQNLSRVYVEMSRGAYAKALRLAGAQEAVPLQPLAALGGGATTAQAVASAGSVATPRVRADETLSLAPAEEETSSLPAEALLADEPLPVPLDDDAAAPPTDAPATAATPSAGTPVSTATPPAVTATPSAGTPVSDATTRAPTPAADEVISLLLAWAGDWAAQRVDAYLGAYDLSFVPNNDLSLQAWQAQRRERLARPEHIEIRLEELAVELTSPDEARVRLLQHYRSDRYRDSTRKSLSLIRRDDGWKIRQEVTLEVL